MKPTRENILSVLARLHQSGALPSDGPTSIFLQGRSGAFRPHALQAAVNVRGDAVFVRISRLPFARPMVFTLREIEEAAR